MTIDELNSTNNILKNEINELDKEYADIINKYKLYETKKRNFFSQINKNKESIQKIEEEELKNKMTETPDYNNIPWETLLDSTKNYSYKLLDKLFQNHKIISNSGYFPETNQHALTIGITNDEDESNIDDAISIINDYTKYAKQIKYSTSLRTESYNKQNSKIQLVNLKDKLVFNLKIRERTCSEYGYYRLLGFDNKWFVVLTRYGSNYQYTNPDTLKNTLLYIKENVYSK